MPWKALQTRDGQTPLRDVPLEETPDLVAALIKERGISHHRVVYGSKQAHPKPGGIWDAALRLSAKLGVGRVEDDKVRNGWRKQHTDKYWVYVAVYMLDAPEPTLEGDLAAVRTQVQQILRDNAEAVWAEPTPAELIFQAENQEVAYLTTEELVLRVDEGSVSINLATGGVDLAGVALEEAALAFWKMVEVAKELHMNAQGGREGEGAPEPTTVLRLPGERKWHIASMEVSECGMGDRILGGMTVTIQLEAGDLSMGELERLYTMFDEEDLLRGEGTL